MGKTISILLRGQKKIKDASILDSDSTRIRIKLKGETSPVFVKKTDIIRTFEEPELDPTIGEFVRIRLKDGSVYSECKVLSANKSFLELKAKRKRDPVKIHRSTILDIRRLTRSGKLVRQISI